MNTEFVKSVFNCSLSSSFQVHMSEHYILALALKYVWEGGKWDGRNQGAGNEGLKLLYDLFEKKRRFRSRKVNL